MKIEDYEKAVEVVEKTKRFKNELIILNNTDRYELRITMFDKTNAYRLMQITEKDIFNEDFADLVKTITLNSMKMHLEKKVENLENELEEI